MITQSYWVFQLRGHKYSYAEYLYVEAVTPDTELGPCVQESQGFQVQ